MFLQRIAKALERSGHQLTYLHLPLTKAASKLPNFGTQGPLTIVDQSEYGDILQEALDSLIWSRFMHLSETYRKL